MLKTLTGYYCDYNSYGKDYVTHMLNVIDGTTEPISGGDSGIGFTVTIEDTDYDEARSFANYQVEFCPLLAMPFILCDRMQVIALEGTPEVTLRKALKVFHKLDSAEIEWRPIGQACNK